MSAQNPTAIDMVNDISIRLTGKIASNQSRPTKAEILQSLNDAQDAICAEKPAYSFLRKTSTIKAWQSQVGNPEIIHSLSTGTIAPLGSLTVDNTTQVFCAYPFTQTSGKIQTISKFSLDTYGDPASGGTANGTFICYAVGVTKTGTSNPLSDPNATDGMPNINDIWATSAEISVVNDALYDGSGFTYVDGGQTTLNFIFDDSVAIGSGDKVFFVVHFTPSITNARNISTLGVTYADKIDPKDTCYVWFNITDYPVPSSIGEYNKILYTVFLSPAIYNCPPIGVTTVGGVTDYTGIWVNTHASTLPADARIITHIYNPAYFVNLNPFPLSAAQLRPSQIPGNVFCIVGEDTDGTLLANLYPTVPYIKEFLVDYIAIPNALVDDTDISIIPREFRAILKYKATMQLVAQNNGINIDMGMLQADYMRLLQKLNETYLPYEDVAMTVNIGGITDNNAPLRDYLNNSNVTNEFPNGWYESKGGSGRMSSGS